MGLVPGQLAVMEAARAVWNLVGEEHLENFAIVGGAAFLFYGASVWTSDVDFATTAQSYKAFEEAAKQDARFSCTVGCYWEYKSSLDILVQFDFLDKDGVGGCLHKLQGYTLIDGIPVATLSDLAVAKGTAWVEREKEKDFIGLEYAVQAMTRQGLNFRGLKEDGMERLDDILEELDQDQRGRRLARVIRTLR